MERPKISIIGAGNVGGTLAYICASKRDADIVLLDIDEGLAKGKALDISQSLSLIGSGAGVIGTKDYQLISDSDIVVITAGIARKPGMSRDDLININKQIVKSAAEQIKKSSPNAMVIVVTNPLDIMVYVALKSTGFEKNRVMGMAGVLDSARFAYFISEKLSVSAKDVNSMMLGGHGDDMLALLSTANIAGVPLKSMISDQELDPIVKRTRQGGAEIVGLLKTGSAFYAPAQSVYKMIDCILYDKKEIMPCSAYLEGEFGASDVCVGVPVILGKNGIKAIIEVALDPKEKGELDKNIAQLKDLISKLGI